MFNFQDNFLQVLAILSRSLTASIHLIKILDFSRSTHIKYVSDETCYSKLYINSKMRWYSILEQLDVFWLYSVLLACLKRDIFQFIFMTSMWQDTVEKCSYFLYALVSVFWMKEFLTVYSIYKLHVFQIKSHSGFILTTEWWTVAKNVI